MIAVAVTTVAGAWTTRVIQRYMSMSAASVFVTTPGAIVPSKEARRHTSGGRHHHETIAHTCSPNGITRSIVLNIDSPFLFQGVFQKARRGANAFTRCGRRS